MDHTAAWFACEIRKNPTRRGTYDEMEINENDKVTGRNPAQEKFAEKSLKYKNSAERKAYGIRKLYSGGGPSYDHHDTGADSADLWYLLCP